VNVTAFALLLFFLFLFPLSDIFFPFLLPEIYLFI